MTATQICKSCRTAVCPQSSLHTIVVATDFSTNATMALNWALELAKTHKARVVLAHTIDTELPALAAAPGIAHEVRHTLEELRKTVHTSNLEVRTICETGKPWDVVAKIARESNADLIVIGAHGQSKLSERVLGTVADRLIKTTSTPVLVHRSTKGQAARGLRTVLAATDCSEEAALAISAAVRLLRGAGEPARMVLFHTIALAIDYGDFKHPITIPKYWDELEQTAARQLEAMAASLRNDCLQVDVKTFRGYPAHAILQEAEAIQADLIALGTVGRTGLNRFFLGSVAERVLQCAKCSVLTARRPDATESIRISAV